MIEITDFSVEINEKEILNNINLSIKEGEIFVLTGKSGCGKSTLLKSINGLIPEMEEANIKGDILFNGESILNLGIDKRSSFISTVFQNPKTQFYCIKTNDELAFALENRNIPREEIHERIDEYTKLLNTQELLNKDIFSLSGGEKQLIAITAVACMNNSVYIFDEPSSSLDIQSIKWLRECFKILQKKGKTIIVAEHRLYYLMDILSSFCVIEDTKATVYYKNDLTPSILQNIQNKYGLRSFNEINIEDISNYKIENIHLLSPSITNDNSTSIFQGKNLQVKYNNNLIFNLNIDLSKGTYFIIGKNGIGKSSFIKLISKLIKGKGCCYYNNKKIKKAYDYISMVMQDVNYQIFTESVWNEISIASDDDTKKEDILKELDLWDKKDFHPQILSGGEKQRLLIALAIVSNKPIVILDEPTSGLDKIQMERTANYISQMHEQGKIIIVITHDYELIKTCNVGTILNFIK